MTSRNALGHRASFEQLESRRVQAGDTQIATEFSALRDGIVPEGTVTQLQGIKTQIDTGAGKGALKENDLLWIGRGVGDAGNTMTLAFPQGPAFIQSIEIVNMGGARGGTVWVFNGGKIARTITFSGSGIVEIGQETNQISILPEEGAWHALKRVIGEKSTPALAPAAVDQVIQTLTDDKANEIAKSLAQDSVPPADSFIHVRQGNADFGKMGALELQGLIGRTTIPLQGRLTGPVSVVLPAGTSGNYPALVRSADNTSILAENGPNMWLDFSTVKERITGATFQVGGDSPDSIFTIHVFRAGDEVTTFEARSGEPVSIDAEEGISAIEIKTDAPENTNSPYRLNGLELRGDSSRSAVDPSPLSIQSNAAFADSLVPPGRPWGKVHMPPGKDTRLQIDPSKHTVIEVIGGGTLDGLSYVHDAKRIKNGQLIGAKEDGVPTDFIVRISPSCIVLLKGAPEWVVAHVSGGLLSVHKNNSGTNRLVVRSGDNIPELLPYEGVKLHVAHLQSQIGFKDGASGFSNAEIMSGYAGSKQLVGRNVFTSMSVTNIGTGIGRIVADVFATSDLHREKQLMATYETEIAGSAMKRLDFNVRLPEYQRYGQVIVQFTLPDGTVIVENGGTVQAPSASDPTDPSVQRRMARNVSKVVTIVQSSDHPIAQNLRTFATSELITAALSNDAALLAAVEQATVEAETVRVVADHFLTADGNLKSNLSISEVELLLKVFASFPEETQRKIAAGLWTNVRSLGDPALFARAEEVLGARIATTPSNGEVAADKLTVQPGLVVISTSADFAVGKPDQREWIAPTTGCYQYKFQVHETTMLNVTLTENRGGNLILRRQDGSQIHISAKSGNSAESISAQIPAGTYLLEVARDERIPAIVTAKEMTTRVNLRVAPYQSVKVEGFVTLDETDQATPVSLSAAEFAPDGRRKAPGEVKPLNPALPIWVVIHGRKDNEGSSAMTDLAMNLAAVGVQVVTLDWHEGAKDNFPVIGLEGSKWIEPTGAWAAQQLRAMGFKSNQVNVVGHSWGSYVAYEIGAHLSGGVQSLVALDPAKDAPLVGREYQGFGNPNFSFSTVTSNSYAFHSSFFGNEKNALTANYSFAIRAPENYETSVLELIAAERLAFHDYASVLLAGVVDEVTDALREHGFAVSLFSELIRRQQLSPVEPLGQLFTPQNLASNAPEFLARADGYEGIFMVMPSRVTNTIGSEAGNTTWKALNFGFLGTAADGRLVLRH